MKKRVLGRTGLKVSEIGFGAWGIGKSMWGPTDDAESMAALRRALEAGIDLFDTAYVYGDGHSETLIGQLLRESRAKPTLATKVPPKNMQWPSAGKFKDAFPADWIASCTERSLKKLGVDGVDLQQLHVWRDEWIGQPGWDDSLKALEALKTAGKVRYWGVSVDSREPKSVLALVRTGLIDTVQVIFNLFEQEPLDELFPLCAEHGVGVIVRVPFDEGGLTGQLRADTRFPDGDFRAQYFAGRLLAETARRADALKHLLVPSQAPDLAHAALRFCLSFPEVSTVIPGMRKAANVDRNANVAGCAPFGPELLAQLKKHAWKRDLTPA